MKIFQSTMISDKKVNVSQFEKQYILILLLQLLSFFFVLYFCDKIYAMCICEGMCMRGERERERGQSVRQRQLNKEEYLQFSWYSISV